MISESEIFEVSLHSSDTGLISNELVISPNVSKTLISLTDDAYCNLRLYKQIFSHQPLIAAKIIKLANFEKKADSLMESVAILGWNKIRGIVSSICLTNVAKESNSVLESTWQQSCLRTILATLISNKLIRSEVENVESICYFLGFGKQQMAMHYPKEYRSVIEMIKEGSSVNEAEQTVFNTIGYELSSNLCTKLNLPQNFSKLIDEYYNAEEDSSFKNIIAISELLSSSIIYGYAQPERCNYLKGQLGIEKLDSILLQSLKNFKLIKKISNLS